MSSIPLRNATTSSLCGRGKQRRTQCAPVASAARPLQHKLQACPQQTTAAAPGRRVAPVRPGRPQRGTTVRVTAVFERFTERSIKAVMMAQQSCKELGVLEVQPEHILLGLVAEATSEGKGYFGSGLTTEMVQGALPSKRSKSIANSDSIAFSRDVRRTFEGASNECKKANMNFISPEHILLALLNMPDSNGRRVLESLGVDCDSLKQEVLKKLKGDQEAEQPKKKRQEKDVPKMMDEYCKDLCAEVRAGRIDPVIGREREVSRVTQILARRTKNNPILLGEPGVGKTAIAEGLAHAIVNCRNPDGTPLPQFLHNRRILQLDVGLIIAGAKERGELESRVTKLIQEMRDAGNVVLMIDEVHTLVGAGSVGRGGGGNGGGGGLDISNLIKPALARGEFQVMGATTIDEHRKYIERDQALERRFQPVYVDEPSEEQTLEILKGLKERYERHHRVVYSDEAMVAAVKLSHKYIADRFLPDKAIDLLDEAGSRVRIQAYTARKRLQVHESPKVREYLQVLDTKDEALKDALYEEAVILKRRELDYKVELAGSAEEGSSLPVVDLADIESVVAAWTGIPVENMGQDEKQRLLTLGSALKVRLIGQEDAVEAVAAALVRARCGLKDPNRPVASLLLVGPTGVGKTELAKVLAEQYFGSRDAMIRLDMSEYMERHSVSKMIGAPPGYVGFGDGGKLTEAVRRRPCSLVLFDEVEKAHPDVFNVLLQLIEDGRLTDSQGRTVSFRNALVILTSNIGSRIIASAGTGTLGAFMGGEGRGGAAAEELEAASQAQRGRLRRLVLDEVKQHFRPELLNRFDEQVVFHRLSRRDVARIATLMMSETRARVEAKGYQLSVSGAVMRAIIRDGYSDEYGVRPLRQTIIRYVDDPLSDSLLHRKVPVGWTLRLELDTATDEVRVHELHPRHAAWLGEEERNDDDEGAPEGDEVDEVVTVEPNQSGFGGSIIVKRAGSAVPTGEGRGSNTERVYTTVREKQL